MKSPGALRRMRRELERERAKSNPNRRTIGNLERRLGIERATRSHELSMIAVALEDDDYNVRFVR
ncbi:MAG: hypothetical protein Q8M24_23470 [Pseudolabrys sp.]|nr:hypothetical protein [Pseudolabrys sp.]